MAKRTIFASWENNQARNLQTKSERMSEDFLKFTASQNHADFVRRLDREIMTKDVKSTSSQAVQNELINAQSRPRTADLISLWQRKSSLSNLGNGQKKDKKRPFVKFTEETNDVKEQLPITCQTVSDRENTIEELRKKNACIIEELKESLTDLETLRKEKNRWKEKAVELKENLENSKESRLHLQRELSERNSAIAALKESIIETDVRVAKLNMETESKDIMISSLNETAQNRKRELEKCYQKLQEKSIDSNSVTKENHEYIQRLSNFNSTLFCSLKGIQNDIQKELMNAKSQKNPSIAEYLGGILEKSDHLAHSMIASHNYPKSEIEQDLYILEESRPESNLVFLKWLRGYLSKLWFSKENEYMKSKEVIFDLTSVIISKEKTNNDLMDQIDYLLVKCKAMSKYIESLENICDNQEFYIKTQVFNAEKMKRAKETMNYDNICQKTNSSRTENVTPNVKRRIQDLLEYNQVQKLENKFERASRELVNVKQEKREMMKKLIASQKHAEVLERATVTKDMKAAQTEDLQNEQTIVQSRLKTSDLINMWQWKSSLSDLTKGQKGYRNDPLLRRTIF